MVPRLFLFLLMLICANGEDNNNSTNNYSKTSPLSKYVLLFSKPGAFAKETNAMYGEEKEIKSKCPEGDEGLNCRRMEARKGTYECSSDDLCSSCRECDESRAMDWPLCCKKYFLCCSRLINACQKCNFPELSPFCARRFKRCV